MSKDGDWIVREDGESLQYIIEVLQSYGAKYRFGAPLDARWLQHGWSSHFEFSINDLRIRTDFVSRPPRINSRDLENIWAHAAQSESPVIDKVSLAELKKTNREKDYAVIGEIARIMKNETDMLKYSRSARDIMSLHKRNPEQTEKILLSRGIPPAALQDRDQLEAALDAERRRLMHANENRLAEYIDAAEPWRISWQDVASSTAGLPLREAHQRLVERASAILPFNPQGSNGHG